jgi:hypothetical protein
LTLPVDVVHDTSFALWWKLVSEAADTPAQGFWTMHDWPSAFLVCLLGLGTGVITIAVMPGMAWLQAWPGFRLLSPDRGTDLALRVAQLTATRAAAFGSADRLASLAGAAPVPHDSGRVSGNQHRPCYGYCCGRSAAMSCRPRGHRATRQRERTARAVDRGVNALS